MTAVDETASAAGVTPGMTLADARALLPGVATMSADPAADAAMLDGLAAWCDRYTPWTAPEGRDGVWLDVSGCAHLFGGERAMLDDLLARLEGFGLEARAVLADTPGAAWALARYGANAMVVTPKDSREALAGLPVAALRLGAAAVDGLTRLGLRRIGDLYAMPRAPLAARFGGEVARRLDQALGREPEPISPRRPPPRHRVRLSFPEPVGLREDIDAALDRLLQALCDGLAQAGRGCRRLDLAFYRADGSVQAVAVGTAAPARDAARLARLFAERLDTVDPGFGIESMILSAPHTEPLSATQVQAPAPARTSSSPQGGRPPKDASSSLQGDRPTRESLAPLLDRLGNRFGFAQVARLRAYESHLPEQACQLVPAAGAMDGDAWRRAMPRPLRLLARPEPVEVESELAESFASTACGNVPLPLMGGGQERGERSVDCRQETSFTPASGRTPLSHSPPQGGREWGTSLTATCDLHPPCAFVWRRVRHRVCAAEGPERITPEWWRGDPAWVGGARDYWRVEDTTGQRFWLFRDGEARWFLHGLFA